jgi:hypothetical protein
LAEDLGTRVALIQALIPLALEAVHDVLQRDVEELAGARYARDDGRPGLVRWSKERGSVYLGAQKLRNWRAAGDLSRSVGAEPGTAGAEAGPGSSR